MNNNDNIKNFYISEIKKYFYLATGIFLTIVGAIGIVLPILPTTIFFILASFCFIKSSSKVNEWLRNHKIFGIYIKTYHDKTGLTIKAKIVNILFLWTMISISAFFLTDEFYIRIILFIIATGVTVHILTIKTRRKQ